MKSVDWLDVYVKHGPERVREFVLGKGLVVEAVEAREAPTDSPAPPADAEADPFKRIIPADPVERARLALLQKFAPPEGASERGWPLRRWNEQWWRHDGIKYRPLAEETIRADLRPWLSSFKTMKKGEPVPFVPKDQTVNELVNNLQTDTLIETDVVPCWLRSEFSQGEPVFGTMRPWQRTLKPKDVREAGLPAPTEAIVFPNGIWDLQKALATKEGAGLELMPHTERYFTTTAMAVECPIEVLRDVWEDPEAWDEEIGKRAPVWTEFLEVASEGEQDWLEGASQLGGVCLTHWTKFHVVPVLTGESRSGKSTLITGGITSLIGEDNYGSSGVREIQQQFHLYSMMGKTACIMPDTDVGRSTDAVVSSEVIKKVSGGDPIFIDIKHESAMPAVRLTCKIIIVCNRMPSLPDPSGALANRFRVLHFPKGFAGKEDRRFSDPAVLEREAVGRMLWAIKGLRLLARLERFVQPARGREVLDEYRNYSDPLRTFVAECLARTEEGAEGEIASASALYDVWKRWCGVAGRSANSHDWFCMQLRTACPWIRRKQVRKDDERFYGYVGLRITNATPDAQQVIYASP